MYSIKLYVFCDIKYYRILILDIMCFYAAPCVIRTTIQNTNRAIYPSNQIKSKSAESNIIQKRDCHVYRLFVVGPNVAAIRLKQALKRKMHGMCRPNNLVLR